MSIPDNLQWQLTGPPLGSGGQGNVHPVSQKGDTSGKQFALKQLHDNQDPRALERFRKEIEVVSEIDHPSIIQIHDFSDENDEFQYYVMDYHEDAEALSETIFSKENSPFFRDTLKSLSLFEKIVDAIHSYEISPGGIVHRDISPYNILLLPDKSIRLIDFGICQIERGEAITLTGENFGTRNYAPPECEAGSGLQTGIYSDIYSAAKVLWSAITSERVFAREEPVFGNQSMKQRFPNKMETWHLSRIFKMTIRKNPGDRHQSAEHLLAQIGNVIRVVRGGFPPQEAIESFCPSCGQNEIHRYKDDYNIFGNFRRPLLTPLECRVCGLVFFRNLSALEKAIEELGRLS